MLLFMNNVRSNKKNDHTITGFRQINININININISVDVVANTFL